MAGQRVALLTVLSLLSCLVRSYGTWLHGKKHVPANSAVFIAKYCFDFDTNGTNTGEVDFTLLGATPATGSMKIILLDDQLDSYPNTMGRWPGFDCGDQRLQTVAKSQLQIRLDTLPRDNQLHTYIVERLRPRFWFIAALDCSGEDREIEYDLHLLNIEQGWLQEISMDHCGIIPLGLFFAVYLGTALMQVHAIFLQSTARTRHPLRLLLTFGICAALWGMGFYFFDTIWYASRGEDTFLMYLAAKLFKAWSKFTLLLILVLLSRGRCISHELHCQDIIHGGVIVAPFLIVCFGLELWGEYDQSRNYTTNFIYWTWVGGVLIFADLLLFGFYVKNLLQTHGEESDAAKKAFYRTWGTIYSTAFLALPAATLIAIPISPWVRVESLFVISNGVHSVLLGLLVIGLWPERTQPVFCIDNHDLASTIGSSLFDQELKTGGRGGDYQQFNMQDSILSAEGNG